MSNSNKESSNILIENWSPLDPEEPVLHHLPFKIAHTGHAQVSKYLLIKSGDEKNNIKLAEAKDSPITLAPTIKRAAFRGRYIRGTEVQLSEAYTGVVFREEEGEYDTNVSDLFEPKSGQVESEEYAYLKNASNIRSWAVQNTFQKYTYWTRNSKPSNSDRHAKWLEWVTSIAPTLHAPLTSDSMTKPFKYVLNAPTTTQTSETGSQQATDPSQIDLPDKRGAKRPAPDAEPEDASIPKKLATEEIL